MHTKNAVNSMHTLQRPWLWTTHNWDILYNIATWLLLGSLDVAYHSNHVIESRRATILQAILFPHHGHALIRTTYNHQVHIAKPLNIFFWQQSNITNKGGKRRYYGISGQQLWELSLQSPRMSFGHLSYHVIYINIDKALDLDSCL